MGFAANLVPNSPSNNGTDGSTVHPLTLTDQNFNDLTKQGVVFVDFWAEWCTPCKMVEPVIEKLANKWQGKVKFGKLNIDENPLIQSKFSIMSIPTFIIFVNGEAKDQISGAGPEPYYEQFLQTNYAKYSTNSASPASTTVNAPVQSSTEIDTSTTNNPTQINTEDEDPLLKN